jgi:hypothetical protein
VFALALTFGSLLAPDPIGIALWIGIALLALSVVALGSSVLQLAGALRAGIPGVLSSGDDRG